jgi:hypothetical protein
MHFIIYQQLSIIIIDNQSCKLMKIILLDLGTGLNNKINCLRNYTYIVTWKSIDDRKVDTKNK